MHKELEGRIERALGERVFPGCVVGFVNKAGERTVLPFGTLTYEIGAPSVSENIVYDVASITKSIPTASLALDLMAQGVLRSADAIKKYVPELRNDHGATIEDLLTYRVSGVQLSTLKDRSAEEILKYVFAQGFDEPSGGSRYTNLPALILGLIVERIAGESLGALAEERFFRPLQMNDTTFFPKRGLDTIAPTEILNGVEVRGIVHDESARVFARAGKAVGHAGLFSTAPDLLNFLEMLLLNEEGSITQGAMRGLGWQTEGVFLGSQPRGRFGKTGFTGTSIVCDIERGTAFVILSNRTYPKRPPDTSAIDTFRRDIADVIFSA